MNNIRGQLAAQFDDLRVELTVNAENRFVCRVRSLLFCVSKLHRPQFTHNVCDLNLM